MAHNADVRVQFSCTDGMTFDVPTSGLSMATAAPRIGRGLALLATYVALEWLSFLHEHDGLPVTPWNPGLGLLFAAMVVGGPAYGVVLFLGVLTAELVVVRSPLPFPVVAAIGAAVALSYAAVAPRVREALDLDSHVLRLRDVAVFLAGSLAGAAASSLLMITLLRATGHFDTDDVMSTVTPLILGDLIGIMVFTPLLLRARSRLARLAQVLRPVALEMVTLGLAIAALVALVVSSTDPRIGLFYLLFVPIGIAAVRHGLDGACLALAWTQISLVALLHLRSFDLSLFTEFQFLMLALTTTGLIIGALVGERQRAEEEARQAASRLQHLRQEFARAARLDLMSGMAAGLAHELNQPLAAARALARSVDVLLADAAGTDRAKANVARMIEQIDHAAAVVTRAREFTRRGMPEAETIDIAAAIDDARALVHPQASARGVVINREVAPEAGRAWGDRIQIIQVLANLLANGIHAVAEAGRDDGAVRIRVTTCGPDAIEISVVDTGAGMQPDQRERLFEPLNTSKPEGTGLGLAICRTIVEAHGGRIWLQTSEPGHTEFRFTLPGPSGARA